MQKQKTWAQDAAARGACWKAIASRVHRRSHSPAAPQAAKLHGLRSKGPKATGPRPIGLRAQTALPSRPSSLAWPGQAKGPVLWTEAAGPGPRPLRAGPGSRTGSSPQAPGHKAQAQWLSPGPNPYSLPSQGAPPSPAGPEARGLAKCQKTNSGNATVNSRIFKELIKISFKIL